MTECIGRNYDYDSIASTLSMMLVMDVQILVTKAKKVLNYPFFMYDYPVYPIIIGYVFE